jgi:flavin-dependent dehydrogenase
VAAGHPADHRRDLPLRRRAETVEFATQYAPRRTGLDTTLLAAAQEAGARVRFGMDVAKLCWDRTGRVAGVQAPGPRQ